MVFLKTATRNESKIRSAMVVVILSVTREPRDELKLGLCGGGGVTDVRTSGQVASGAVFPT